MVSAAVTSTGSRSSSSDMNLLDESPYLSHSETCAELAANTSVNPPHCPTPRSCRSCLQKTGCMVSEYGWCVDKASYGYHQSMDYRQGKAINANTSLNAVPSNESALNATQHWQFPAFEARYCASDDSVCLSCIEAHFWSEESADSRYCVGGDGCVCISVCESNESEPMAPCARLPTTVAASDESSIGLTVKIIGGAVGVLVLLMAACLFRCIRREYDHRRHVNEMRRQQRLIATTGRRPQQQRSENHVTRALSLPGWQTYRKSAIEKEMRRLKARNDDADINTVVSPATTTATYVLFDDVSPADGPADGAETSTTNTLV